MPEKATVLIFPGGCYSWLSQRESFPVERALHRAGFRAAVLCYEVEKEVLGLAPLKQAAWGVAKVREIYPGDPVYVLGFSAGSHCAGSLAVHWNHRDWEGKDLFQEVKEFLGDPSLPADCFRPDRAALSYPVISSGPYAHADSFMRLTGIPAEEIRKISAEEIKNTTEETADRGNGIIAEEELKRRMLQWFSLEKQADKDTPPVFLWHTAEDESVPVQNSLLFADALVKAKVPVEMHIFPHGVHGLSLATEEVAQPENKRFADPHVAGWFDALVRWMKMKEIV
ncbi:MAG: prolyl oligopeptidase family serine peptidase [Stomatobaculum sp.]|nr:prolyl oligopeptidase family serine peptidase [Stomatobaculum sp.]